MRAYLSLKLAEMHERRSAWHIVSGSSSMPSSPAAGWKWHSIKTMPMML